MKPTLGQGKMPQAAKRSGRTLRMWSALKSRDRAGSGMGVVNRRLRCRYVTLGVGHDSQKMWTRARQEFPQCSEWRLCHADGNIEYMGEQTCERPLSPTVISQVHSMLHFSVECTARELIVTEPHTPSSFCGCLAVRVCVALWRGCCVAEGRAFSVK